VFQRLPLQHLITAEPTVLKMYISLAASILPHEAKSVLKLCCR